MCTAILAKIIKFQGNVESEAILKHCAVYVLLKHFDVYINIFMMMQKQKYWNQSVWFWIYFVLKLDLLEYLNCMQHLGKKLDLYHSLSLAFSYISEHPYQVSKISKKNLQSHVQKHIFSLYGQVYLSLKSRSISVFVQFVHDFFEKNCPKWSKWPQR